MKEFHQSGKNKRYHKAGDQKISRGISVGSDLSEEGCSPVKDDNSEEKPHVKMTADLLHGKRPVAFPVKQAMCDREQC